MKKLLVLFVMMLSAGSLMAQYGHRGLDYKVDFGYDFSTKSGGPKTISATGIIGKRINDYLFVGGGSGAYMDQETVDNLSKDTYVPIFADFRGYYPLGSITSISPFLGVKGGYVINAVSSSGSDFYIFQITPGVQIPLSGVIDLNVAVGYECWMPTMSEWKNINFIALRLGFGFHKNSKK